MRELYLTAFDHGITHFDLTNNYGPPEGAAELNFGRILKEDLGVYRDELIISTKSGYWMWPGPYGEWGSRKQLLASAVQSGKALYVGLANYDGERMEQAVVLLRDMRVPFIINQNCYSIFDRSIEHNGLKEASVQLGKGVIAFSPLAQGLLTDRYLKGIPADSRIMTDGRFLNEGALTQERLNQIRQLNDLASQRGQTLAQMALSRVLRDGIVTSVLAGASKPQQVLDNIRAAETPTLRKRSWP